MYQIVLCNCSSQKEAENIAQRLVADKLAACVNIVGNITSIYQWQGEIQTDKEVMLIIKTQQSLFQQLEKAIIAIHSYDVVEVIALDIQQGNELYLNWIKQTVNPN